MMTENISKKGRLDFFRNPLFILFSIAFALFLGLLIRRYTLIPSDSFISNFFNGLNQLLISGGIFYINLLEMTIYPIVISSIITSIVGLIKSKFISQFIIRFLVVFFTFYLLISIVGVISGTIFKPGKGLSYESQRVLGKTIIEGSEELEVSLSEPIKNKPSRSVLDFLDSIIPDNAFKALVNDNKIQAILFSIIFGIAIGLLKGQMGSYLDNFFKGIMESFQLIMGWIFYLLPLGIICLLASQIALAGLDIFLAMAKFILIFLCATIAILILNTVIIWRRSKKNFFYVIKALMDPIVISLVTRNSFVTLPIVVKTMDKKLGFFQRTSQLFIPLGTTVGRFGNILYFSLAAVFVAQVYDLELAMSHYIIIVFGSILSGLSSAGTTGPATISVLSLVLIPLGLPVHAVLVVFIAIDSIIDPLRTLLIVHSNMATTSLIAERVSTGDRRIRVDKLKPIITLRTSIVFFLSASIILTGVTTSSVAYKGSKDSVYHLAEDMMQEITNSVNEKTANYLQSAEGIIKEIGYLIENDKIDIKDTDDFLAFLREILEINGEIGAIYLGAPDGNFAMTKRMLDGSYSYRVITRSNDSVFIDWRHDNENYNDKFRDDILPVNQGYDPRKRGWYNSAINEKDIIWEDVYVFASDRIPGISCAMPIFQDDGNLLAVLGIDIGVIEFSYFLGDINLSKTGKAILLNNKDEIIAMSAKEDDNIADHLLVGDQNLDKLSLVLAEDSNDKLIRSSYLTYQASYGLKNLPVFSSDGTKYIAYYHRYTPNIFFNWSIGVVIPEDSIMQEVNRNNIIVLSVSSFFIVLSLILGIQFSKSVSKPLQLLSKEMEKVQNFTLDDIRDIPSSLKEVHEMNYAFQKMIVGLRSFKKYVPSNLVSKLVRLGKEAVIGGEKRNLTLFFSDIKNFTSIAEKLAPETLVEELVEYLSMFSRKIIEHKGTVDKYMGDGIMAFWGAPDEVKDHAVLTCYAALDCQEIITNISKNHPESILARFLTRIGIHTGDAIVGNMGSDERLDYTVIGDSANLASRLEGMNTVYGTKIIISESTNREARNFVETRLLDKVAVKGRSQGVYIYELIAKSGELNESDALFIKGANRAANLYFSKEWNKAYILLEKILKMYPDDIPSRILLKRCQEYLQNPPPDKWNGVYVFNEKY